MDLRFPCIWWCYCRHGSPFHCKLIPKKSNQLNHIMSELVNLNKESFDKVISSKEKTLIIDFWAPWCGPCKALSPVLEELSSEMSDQVGIYKVNVDDNTELAQEHGVQSIPTLLVYKNGSLSETIVGLKTKEELIEIVNA
ncbi:MAG: thioredoxin [Opitutales bacterium]